MPGRTWSPAASTSPSRLEHLVAEVVGSGDGSLQSVSGLIGQGFDFRVFASLQDILGLTQSELAGLLRISESTLYRRRRSGSFDAPESDRIWQYLQLYARAIEVLEEHHAALEWLRSPMPALGGRTPLLAARDSAGAQQALAVLGRIEHGVFG